MIRNYLNALYAGATIPVRQDRSCRREDAREPRHFHRRDEDPLSGEATHQAVGRALLGHRREVVIVVERDGYAAAGELEGGTPRVLRGATVDVHHVTSRQAAEACGAVRLGP